MEKDAKAICSLGLPPEEQQNCEAELEDRCNTLIERLRKYDNDTDLVVVGK